MQTNRKILIYVLRTLRKGFPSTFGTTFHISQVRDRNYTGLGDEKSEMKSKSGEVSVSCGLILSRHFLFNPSTPFSSFFDCFQLFQLSKIDSNDDSRMVNERK